LIKLNGKHLRKKLDDTITSEDKREEEEEEKEKVSQNQL
jgi:hypothetical protein